jgi:transmembrane sensor
MTAPQDNEPATGAEAVWAEASDWLAERETGEWSHDRQVAFDVWLAESSAHLLAYWRVEAGWARTHRLAALRPPADPPLRRQIFQPPRASRPRIVKAAAAIVAVGALAGMAMFYSPKPAERTFATATGGHEIVSLADGSTIELNTDTTLRLTQGRSGRMARLEKGEAYFQIRHDAAHPFVVVAGDHRVTDLGTKFVLRRDPGKLKVSLLEGSARVEAIGPAADFASVTLKPGDVAIATADTLAVTKRPERQLKNDLAWRRGLLVFNNTPLGNVVAELNRYNATKLAVADPATAGIAIGGTFPADNPAALVGVAPQHLRQRGPGHGNQKVILPGRGGKPRQKGG